MTEEEMREIVDIAAQALVQEFGEAIKLEKTPRVLTVQEDLIGSIRDWKEVLTRCLWSREEEDVSTGD
ncbi:hypothetical protein ACHAW6_001691 [Cyclotella cf. meneghiniana]